MKKCFKIFVLLIIALLVSSVCFAATPVSKGSATMVLVEDNVNSMTFGTYGEFEKKMIAIDTEKKTVDIKLTVKNNQEELKNGSAEIVLLIDSSKSMSTNTVNIGQGEITRKELVLEAASQLIAKLLETKQDIKIGVVAFATSFESDTDSSKAGTDADAITVTKSLTNDSEKLNSALETVRTETMGSKTDIQVGLETADKLLETSNNKDANKYIVVLTDAIPNTARNVPVDLYTKKTADPTKETLKKLDGKGIDVISMLINISNETIKAGNRDDMDFQTYKEVAEYVFGDSTAPTAGSVYYVNDSEVIETVTESIYSELIPVNEYILTDIVIKDYFPQYIIDNFDFALLTEPEIGKVTAEVNKNDNSITWTISELGPGQTATFNYRLSLKETFSSDIVGEDLPTNKDVSIDYKENKVPGEQKHNDKAPVIALDVPAPKPIPQTGSNTTIISASLVAVAVVIATVSFIILKRQK